MGTLVEVAECYYPEIRSLGARVRRTVTPAYSAVPKGYYIQEAVGIGI
jgi:hypothetical protein